jgi:four helix bundle protein
VHGPQHERLDVYAKALDAVAMLVMISQRLPEPWGDLRDQLRRAATSIPLNIAEGAAEFSPAEKAKFYRYARRSSSECMAVLDIVARVIRPPPPTVEVKKQLDDINAMLTGLIRVQE